MAVTELGSFIRSLRGNLSLRDAAEKIGISHTYLSDLEKGKDRRNGNILSPTPEVLKMLADGYGCSYHELMLKAGYLSPGTDAMASDIVERGLVSIGKRLKELRLQRGLKQGDIADWLGLSGNNTISQYESNMRDPNFETLCKLADLFGVSTDYLLGRVDELSDQKEAQADLMLYQVLDKLTRMERDITDLKKASGLSERALEKIEEHDMDIRLLKKLAAKE